MYIWFSVLQIFQLFKSYLYLKCEVEKGPTSNKKNIFKTTINCVNEGNIKILQCIVLILLQKYIAIEWTLQFFAILLQLWKFFTIFYDFCNSICTYSRFYNFFDFLVFCDFINFLQFFSKLSNFLQFYLHILFFFVFRF